MTALAHDNPAHDTPAHDTPAGRTRRIPGTVIAASVLTFLVAGFGAYGGVYFSGMDGFSDMDLTFLTAYEFITATGVVGAVQALRGRPAGRYGLITYCVWMAVFTAFKVGYIHEVEAIPFGVVGLGILALALTRSLHRHTAG
jgi:hypothetical protein